MTCFLMDMIGHNDATSAMDAIIWYGAAPPGNYSVSVRNAIGASINQVVIDTVKIKDKRSTVLGIFSAKVYRSPLQTE